MKLAVEKKVISLECMYKNLEDDNTKDQEKRFKQWRAARRDVIRFLGIRASLLSFGSDESADWKGLESYLVV